MPIRRLAFSLALLGLAACSSSTEPKQQSVALDAVPDIGPTLTIAGPSMLGSGGGIAVLGLGTGNPLSIAAAQSSLTLPPPPVCAPVTPQGLTSCTTSFNGLNFAYTFGWADTLGLRSETTVTGTLPADGTRPARRISRRATSWTNSIRGDTAFLVNMRTRSNESGTLETLGSPSTVSVDTGSTDIRFYLKLNLLPVPGDARSMPRLVGTSRRVVWTRVNGGPATFWRETTTYDSSTVIRSVIETPSGTRRCSIDLGAPTFVTICN